MRLNRAKVHSASQGVRMGDVLTITLPRAILVYEIAGLAERRGPYSQASQLYIDRSPPMEKANSDSPEAVAPPALKRPEGRDRRAARRLAGKPE